MGTPDFAARVLKGLLDSGRVDVRCVYTRPDKPAGRGKKLLPPPVKTLALERGLVVRQPLSLKPAEEQEALAAFRPEFLVVAAYGMILPKKVLDIPTIEPVNVHTSLLPAYRGAAPAQRAIMDGVSETGVSIMRIVYELDAGPVFARKRMPVGRLTAGAMLQKMAAETVPMVMDVLDKTRLGEIRPVEQSGLVSYAARITKADGILDVRRPLAQVDCHMRGVTPDPGAHVTLCLPSGDVAVVLEEAEPAPDEIHDPGLVLASRGRLLIACEGGCLAVKRLKPVGRKSMDAAAFLNGQRLCHATLTEVGFVRAPGDA